MDAYTGCANECVDQQLGTDGGGGSEALILTAGLFATNQIQEAGKSWPSAVYPPDTRIYPFQQIFCRTEDKTNIFFVIALNEKKYETHTKKWI